MARADLHGMINHLSGTLGNVVFKNRNGKVYISARPNFKKRKLSIAQKENIAKFRDAVAFAKATMRDANALKSYERLARKNGKSVYGTLITEFMKR